MSYMYGYKPDLEYDRNPFLRYKLFDRTPSVNLVSTIKELQTLVYPSRILDLGCGDGILEYLAGANRNYTFTSVDIEPNAIEKLNEIFQSHNKYGDLAIVGDISHLNKLNLAAKQYDACIAWRVIHGISPLYYNHIFETVYELLKPRASLFISVASDQDWKRFALGEDYDPSGINDCTDIMFGEFGIKRDDTFPVHFFTKSELKMLGERNGFSLKASSYFKEASGYDHLKDHYNTYLYAKFIKE